MKRMKRPELKVPDFLSDLYWDLRDRHLLPLVALGLVAIVAVPILLSQGSEDTRSLEAGAISALREEGGHASELTVVEANPGLRDYRKRLRGRTPTDPFRQPAPKQNLEGAQLGGGQGGGGSGSSSSASTTTREAGGSTGDNGSTAGSGGAGGSGGGSGQLTEYTTAVDVKITTTKTLPSGKKEKSKPELRKRVLPTAPLPSDKVQAVVYMGIGPKSHEPVLLVSDAVTGVFGEGRCLSGTETCQLLEVEPGMPEMFVFGPESVRYKIVVLNPRPVPIGHKQL